MKPSLLLILLATLLSGCATLNGPADPRDPLERYNRAMHNFNEGFDRRIFRPLAEGYVKVTPSPVRRSIGNFFSNLNDIWVMTNNLLQGKPGQSASDLSRVIWNTTVGIGGLFDVASHLELPKHNEDFGQTLGVWGVGSGPYLVLPLLGPSTVRDTAGRAVQWHYDPLGYWVSFESQVFLTGLNLLDSRASLLRTTRLIDAAALDSYSFTRDAYLQRREFLIHDGHPPQEEFDPFADDF